MTVKLLLDGKREGREIPAGDIRELVRAGATKIKTVRKLAMKHRLHFLGKLLH